MYPQSLEKASTLRRRPLEVVVEVVETGMVMIITLVMCAMEIQGMLTLLAADLPLCLRFRTLMG